MKLKKTLMASALLACCGAAFAQSVPALPANPASAAPAAVSAPALAQPSALANPQAVGQPAPQASNPQNAPRSLPPLPAQAPQSTGPTGAAPQTFEEIMSNTLGMTAAQIRELRRQTDDRQRAAAQAPQTPPKPVTNQVTASTSPGATSPVVRLFPGFATSIIITDSTGQPWPIENFAVGQKDMFDVKRLDQGNGSALSIVPLGYYAQSNLILFLKGLPTPIAISFLAGQKEVDFRVDVRVQGRGPNSQVSLAGLPDSANTELLSLLEGVPPSDAKVLKTSSPSVKAWLAKSGRMFVRTNQSVISPAWIGSARSADGTSAYEMKPSSSILLMQNGENETVNVQGW